MMLTRSASLSAPARRPDLTWTRMMLQGNAWGAGAMAALTLAAPDATAALVDLDADPAVWRLVGAMWLGFACSSAIGLRFPERYRGVLVAQVIYKSVFLAAAAPAALSRPGLAALLAVFAALIAGYAHALRTSAPATL